MKIAFALFLIILREIGIRSIPIVGIGKNDLKGEINLNKFEESCKNLISDWVSKANQSSNFSTFPISCTSAVGEQDFCIKAMREVNATCPNDTDHLPTKKKCEEINGSGMEPLKGIIVMFGLLILLVFTTVCRSSLGRRQLDSGDADSIVFVHEATENT